MFKNTFKTFTLLAALGGLLVVIGRLIGGPRYGVMIGLGLGLVMVGGSYWFSDKLAIRSARARPLEPHELPWLHQSTAQLAEQAGIPTPRLYVSPDSQPNAFATGRNPRNAVVCVTQGLVQMLEQTEVAGVVAHELAHVKHRDILIGSVAAAVATGISALANFAMFAGMFGGSHDDDDRPNPIAMLLLALLAPMAAGIIQMAVSRSREFEADRAGASFLGDARPLASALAKLDGMARRVPMNVNPAQAQAYIVNPFSGRQVSFAHLFQTHPPMDERIRRLLAHSTS